jgi:hypothetical protein
VEFNEAAVAMAPASPGVYMLYQRERLIYIGIAVHGTGIRQQLEKHFAGRYGPRTRAATSFEYEVTRDPVLASREHLLAHMARNRGRLPICNRADGPLPPTQDAARDLRADR